MKRPLYAFAVGVVSTLLVCWGVGWGVVTRAKAEALEARARVQVAHVRREYAEGLADAARMNLIQLADTLAHVRDSVAVVRSAAQRVASAAAQAASDITNQARAEAGDSVAVVALLDSLTAAHDTERTALLSEIGALERERAILHRRVQADSVALLRSDAVNAALRVELAAVTEQSAAWERAANPPLVLRAGKELLKIGIAYGLGRATS